MAVDYDALLNQQRQQEQTESTNAPAVDYDAQLQQARAADAGQHPGGFLQSAGAGLLRGAQDVLDTPVRLMARGTDYLGLTQGKGQEMADLEHQRAAQYNKDYSGNLTAGLGRFAGNVAGTAPLIASGEGAIGALADISGAGRVANAFPPLMKLAGIPLKGAAEGAAATALTSGPNDPNATDVGLGAGLGAGVGTVAKGIGAGAGALADRFPGLGMAPQTAGRALSGAVQKAQQALSDAGISPLSAYNKMKQLGPDATLADVVGGERAAKAGVDPIVARGLLDARHNEQATRLNDVLTQATGTSANFYDTEAQLLKDRAAKAAPLFDQANANTIVTPAQAKRLQPFIATPIGQKALQDGLEIARNNDIAAGKEFDPKAYGVDQDQDGRYVLDGGVPNLQLYHTVKEGYDNIVEGYRDSTTGRLALDKLGRSVNNLRAGFVGALREQFPQYAEALNSWGGDSEALDALNFGRRALQKDPEVTAARVAAMSDNAKDFYKIGLTREMQDMMMGTGDARDVVNKMFGNQLIRNKTAAAFDDPQSFAQWREVMQREASFVQTRAGLMRAKPQAAGETGSGWDAVRPLARAAVGDFHGAARDVLGTTLARAANSGGADLSSDVTAQLNDLMLRSGDPESIYNTLTKPPGFWGQTKQAVKAAGKASVVPGSAALLPRWGDQTPPM